jgi:hypothetical protein
MKLILIHNYVYERFDIDVCIKMSRCTVYFVYLYSFTIVHVRHTQVNSMFLTDTCNKRTGIYIYFGPLIKTS